MGRYFIPVYGVYWLFAGPLAQCTGLDIALPGCTDALPGPGPRTVAVLAAVSYRLMLVVGRAATWAPFWARVVSDALWLVYMWQCNVGLAKVAEEEARVPAA